MKIKVGLIGKGKWGLKIKKKLAKIADLKFVIGKKKNFFNDIKKNNIRWVFIATPNTTHYSIVKKCLKTGINVFCEKPLCLSLIQAKTLVNLAKKKNLKLYVSDLYSFYSSCLKKLNIKNNVYRAKFVNEKNPEFLNRLMYHDICVFYKFFKKNPMKNFTIKLNKKNKIYEVLFNLKKKQEIKFEYNLNSKKKKHIINDLTIKSKKDFLNKMIFNVLYKKVNFQENNLKALFIIKLLNTIKRKVNYVN